MNFSIRNVKYAVVSVQEEQWNDGMAEDERGAASGGTGAPRPQHGVR